VKFPVRVVGGPLDGNVYELQGDIGEQIELDSAAGVGVYEFAKSENGETVLNFLGPGWPTVARLQ